MTDRLRVTELDFDTIKNNLKSFLSQQTLFTDYNFEGSGLNILLDLLAYNTHYEAYYLNMVANEAFLDTAILRDSVVSHAKSLSYTPQSKKSAQAYINLEVLTGTTDIGTLKLPRGFSFLSNQIDGISYNFVVLNDFTVTKSNTSYIFENVAISEGQLTNYSFTQDQSTNPNQIFGIPDASVDISTLQVYVSPSSTNTSITYFNQATDITDIESNTPVYFVQEGRGGLFQIYFGNDVIGQKIPDGGIVYVNYLVTNNSNANQANNFIATSTLTDSLSNSLTNFNITPVTAASGGKDRESVDSIKYAAPIAFSSQNRFVTTNDYKVLVKKIYPNIEDISVWGGEDEMPPIFGKVFISLVPVKNSYLSSLTKQNILDDIKLRGMLTVQSEIRDPEYLYLLVDVNVQYDQSKTMLNMEGMNSIILNSILTYNSNYLNTFSSKFVQSKLEETINYTDTNSIIGCYSTILAQKRFIPILGIVNNYNINFNIPLLPRNAISKLTSSVFSVYDSNGNLQNVTIEETPNSSTAINSVSIIDPGSNYSSAPTITITGDGIGATATATLINGKIGSIDIIDGGTDYTKAIVNISGGGGFGSSAVAVINSQVGILRTTYFNPQAVRQVVNANIGTIDYVNGIINLKNINIVSTNTSDSLIRIQCPVASGIIKSFKNNIITIDTLDPNSITINTQAI